MKRLSTEILITIFNYLHYKQKTECMLVCRLWANILCSGHDLETIKIVAQKDRNQYECLMEKFKTNDNDYGKKCKRLKIESGYYGSNPSLIELATRFPNLTHFSSNDRYGPRSVSPQPFTEHEHKRLESWRNNLVRLEVYDFGIDLFDVLEFGVFNSLTTLKLRPRGYQDEDSRVIFEKLKNTPHLASITLDFMTMEMYDLEKLHKNLPKLNSLTLVYCKIKDAQGVPDDIQPAHGLKTFNLIQSFLPLELPPSITHYLTSKYSNIKQLALLDGGYLALARTIEAESRNTTLLRTIGQNLTHLEMKFGSKLPKAIELYNVAQLSSLEYLSASLFLSKRLLQKIVSPAVLQNIKTLKLSQVPHLDFSIFKGFAELKVLDLAFKEKSGVKFPFELNTILNHHLPNTIETLGFGFAEIRINPNEQMLDSNIKQFLLKRSELSEKIAGYLTQHFKRLDVLFLLDCKVGLVSRGGKCAEISVGKPIFELPGHQLSLVSIKLIDAFTYSASSTSYREGYFTHTNLKLVVGNDTYYYNSCRNIYPSQFKSLYKEKIKDGHDRTLQTIRRSDPFNADAKYFEFKCANVQTIYFNGYLIL